MREHVLQNVGRGGTEPSAEPGAEELKELRAVTASLIESTAFALIVLDKNWCISFLNEAAINLFEMANNELIGRPLAEVYPRNLGFILKPDTIRKMIDSGNKTNERYSSHLVKWFKISVHSSDIGIIIWLEDITSSMIRNRLYRLNEFSINHLKDMVFWVKPGSHIIYSNVSSRELLGYDATELTSKKFRDIAPGFTWDIWQKYVKDIQAAGSLTFETCFITKDERQIPVELTCNFLDYYDDEYIVVLARDITERRKYEYALKKSQSEAELYLDLLSHDINNINQISLGYLELAMESASCDENLQELLSKPIGALNDSANLIDNVNTLRKVKDGGLSIQHMDLGDLLEVTIKKISSSSSSYGGGVYKEVLVDFKHGISCKITANELINEVFANLIGNSIKHSVSDSVRINIGIEQAVENGKPYCSVFIEDDGPGIPDELKAKLFTKFKRGGTRIQGRGMGLYLVKSLIEDFHGKVWVEDRIKGDHTKGAKFIVRLPVAE